MIGVVMCVALGWVAFQSGWWLPVRVVAGIWAVGLVLEAVWRVVLVARVSRGKP